MKKERDDQEVKRTRRRACGYGCLVFFVLLAAVISGGFFAARYYVRRGMTPSEIAEMNAFFEEPVEVPEEWRNIPPVPQDVQQTADEAFSALGDLTDKVWMQAWRKLAAGEDLKTEEWKAVEEFLDRQREFLGALASLVNLDGYTMNALGEPAGDISKFIQVQAGAKFLTTRAYLLAREEDWSGSLEAALSAVRVARRHRGSHLYIHLFAFAIEGMGSRCISQLALRCDNRESLRTLLEEMNRLDPKINLDALDDPLFLFIVGELRYYDQLGYSVDLSSEAPRAYFYRQMVDLHRQTGKYVGEFTPLVPWYKRAITRSAAHSRIAAETLYRTTRLEADEGTEKREHVAEALFDLARLAVASRLYELERGRPPASMADLVPDYLDGELVDPFGQKPYRLKEKRSMFYSIGPDGTDGAAAIRYDSTNGTMSRGDIFLKSLSAAAAGDNTGQ